MTQYDNIHLLRNDILKIDAVLQTKKDYQWVSTQIDIMPCVVNSEISLDVMKSFNISNGVCFNTSGLYLEGSYTNDIYQYIQIRFNLCIGDNLTNENDSFCYPEEEMEEFFQKTKPVSIVYFLDSAFQIYNSTDKISKFYNYLDNNLTYQNYKETNLYYSNNKMQVDESYLFPSEPESYSGFMIESTRDKGSLRYKEDKTLMVFNFMSSNYQTIIHISYIQIPEFLTSVCAMINVLVIITNGIGNYFNYYLFQSDLMNSFYELDIPDDGISYTKNQKLINIKLNSKFPLNNSCISSQTNIFPHSKSLYQNRNNKSKSNINNNNNDKIPNINTELSSNSITHIIHRKKCDDKHNFNHMNIIKLSFATLTPCVLNRHTKRHIYSFTQINQSLIYYQELINVYKKLMEIDLLKYLILSEDQLSLYKLIPKPQYNSTNCSKKKTNKDFCSLINDSDFHFLKTKEYIEKALNNNNEMKELFVSKDNKSDINRDDKITEKVIELINRQIIVCSIQKEKNIKNDY